VTVIANRAASFLVALHKGMADSLEAAIPSIPGWQRFERFCDQMVDGVAFTLALLWVTRWIWIALALALLAVGLTN
jgi:hypothetical protein